MKRLRAAVSLITDDNDYQREQGAAAESAARGLEIDLEIFYAGGDAIEQSQQLLHLIQTRTESRPDFLLIEPAGTSMPQVAEAAVSAGIGWVLLNRDAEYITALRRQFPAPVCSVQSDNHEIGRIQARQFSALLPEGGCVLYIEGPSSSEVAQRRKKGLLETLPKKIDIKAVRGAWTEISAYNAVNAWLKLSTSRELRLGAVGSQNDAMAIGARKAFHEVSDATERDKWLHLPFTGCDGVPGTGQTWVRKGFLNATVVIPPLTGFALEIVSKALRTGVQPAAKSLIASKSLPPIDQIVPQSLSV